MTTRLHGASEQAIKRAVRSGDPFTGDSGYGGVLSGGTIVRDVLGRYPVFVEAHDLREWAFDPQLLSDPVSVPSGHVLEAARAQRIWALPERQSFSNHVDAVRAVDRALVDSCDTLGDLDCAIGYSAGIDSNLLAAHIDVPRYTVGFSGSKELVAAEDASDETVHTIELTHDDLLEAIPAVARSTGRTNAMDLAIGLSLYLLAKRVAADGYTHVVLGQGADELFGGYEKIAQPDHRVDADTVLGARREILEALPGGLERDVLAVRAAGVEPMMPYLNDGVVQTALRLDREHLFRRGVRKPILRDVASNYLPTDSVGRKKHAIQYGNGVARELDRLARQAGYKRRIPNHVGKFVDAVLNHG